MENSKIYKASGEIIDIYPENNKNFSLTELQNIVGGYIEIILTNKPGYLLVLNEEGKLQNLRYNEEATKLVDKVIQNKDFIVGDVLYCKKRFIK